MKLLITGAWKHKNSQIEELRNLGFEIVKMEDERGTPPASFDEIDAVVCNGLFLYHDISNFTNLRYIQLTSAGYDRVDMDYISKHNIKISNARGVYSIPMAEHVILGVLQLYRHSSFYYKNQKEHKWDKHRDELELFQKKVCIVGAGNVGCSCAKLFNAFECAVVGVDIFANDKECFEKIYDFSQLDEAIKDADIVVLTAPLTKETKGLMNENRLEKMKKGAILVNVSRGQLVNEPALLNALKSHLGGAVLDVFENEPLDKESDLWDLDNVVITPHSSFIGENNDERLWTQIREFLKECK